MPMGSRVIKKKAINIFFLILFILFFVGISILGFNIWESLSPIFKGFTTGSNKQILKPISNTTGIQELKKKLAEKNIIFKEIFESTNSSSLIVGEIEDGPRVYFSKNKETEWQVNSLQLIILKLEIDNKKPNYIDLRGVRPIVKF